MYISFAKLSLKRSWQTFFFVLSCIFHISRKTFCKIKKLSYTNFYRNLVTWYGWSMALRWEKFSCLRCVVKKACRDLYTSIYIAVYLRFPSFANVSLVIVLCSSFFFFFSVSVLRTLFLLFPSPSMIYSTASKKIVTRTWIEHNVWYALKTKAHHWINSRL